MKLKLYYRGENFSGRPTYQDETGRVFADDISEGNGEAKLYLVDGDNGAEGAFVGDKYDFIFIPRYITREIAGMDFLHQTCPMCGNRTVLHLDPETIQQLEAYQAGNGLIQDCLPNLTKYERELIKTGYCYTCQNQLFSTRKFTLTEESVDPDLEIECPVELDENALVVHVGFRHEGGQWNRKTLSENTSVSNSYVLQEIEEFFSYMTQDALNRGRSDIPVLCEFLAVNDKKCNHEYSLFYEGHTCDFWVRLFDKDTEYMMQIYVYLESWVEFEE